MTEVAVVMLPWPNRTLHPNARGHHMALARARKKARHDAWLATLAHVPVARRAALKDAGDLRVHVRFFPPDRRDRDEDGCVASVKSHLDGIADALGVNDSRFRLSHAVEGPTKGGRVLVEITAREPGFEHVADVAARLVAKVQGMREQ